ncbi:MAG: NfeD family protein, partial [Casimicrobiaceae bacterium]
DVPDLLRRLDGRKVNLATGERTLQTSGAPMEAIDPDWTSRLLVALTDPSVALVLMLLGVYGLLFELGNPGYVFPGVIGAICLLLALYALHLLPVNYAGLALIAVGILFMVAELFLPAYGSLGVGGVVVFAVGAVMLIDAGVPGFSIPWSLIAALALVTVAFVLIVGNLALRARRAPIVSGMTSLVGADGEMLDDAAGTGWANIRGETWKVATTARLTRGQKIRVIGVDGETPRVASVEGA